MEFQPGLSTNTNKERDSRDISTSVEEYSKRNNVSAQAYFSQHGNTTILPTAIIDIDYAGELFTVRALLDGGSEKTFITRRLQQTLKLPVSTHHTQITGLGGTIVGNSSSQCFMLIIKSKNSNFILNMNAIVVSKLTSFLPSRYVKNECIPQFKELQLADPEFYKPAPIDIIIGSDFLPYIK